MRGTARYGWLAVALGVVALAYITLNTLRSEGPGSRGLRVGERVPPFAAPLATGPVQGDVNVARRAGQGSAGDTPACRVRGDGILNSCELAGRGPFALAFIATRGSACTRELDRLQRVGARHPGVQVAAVSIRGNRGDLSDLVRSHGWRFPVAYDRDGILANRFAVAVCPQITYALPGGRVQATSVGELTDAQLDRRLGDLERAAARARRPS